MFNLLWKPRCQKFSKFATDRPTDKCTPRSSSPELKKSKFEPQIILKKNSMILGMIGQCLCHLIIRVIYALGIMLGKVTFNETPHHNLVGKFFLREDAKEEEAMAKVWYSRG